MSEVRLDPSNTELLVEPVRDPAIKKMTDGSIKRTWEYVRPSLSSQSRWSRRDMNDGRVRTLR
jgi:hypothetical protein